MIDQLGTPDGVTLDVRQWPVAEPRAVIQVVHGMAEHMGRYDEFAQAMNAEGFAVVGHDQRGHGATAGSAAERGFIAEREGWPLLVDDVGLVARAISREYPDAPIILLGHSMGTVVARAAVQEQDHFAALICSGAVADPGPARRAGLALAHAQIRLKGPRHRSMTLHRLSFGGYNKAVEHPRTAFDWLSRDHASVDAYVADEACGWIATAGFYRDLFVGLGRVNDPARIRLIARDLPVLFISGDTDPVGGRFGGGVAAAARAMRRRLDHVDVRLYAQARHELFHELNREEIFSDVLRWCDAVL